MTTERVSKIWAFVFLIICFIYPISAAITFQNIINNILKSFGILWDLHEFGESLLLPFILVPVFLIYYAYRNPQILYVSVADQKRAVLTKMFWEKIGVVPDDKLDLVGSEIRNGFLNILNDSRQASRAGEGCYDARSPLERGMADAEARRGRRGR